MGTSSAVMSMTRLSSPRPAQADIRCSMVCTVGCPGVAAGLMVVAMRVSLTDITDTGISTGTGRSTRRKTMPVSGGAGLQRQLDLLAAVHAHAHGMGDRLQGALREHGCIVPHQGEPCPRMACAGRGSWRWRV
jgi:hypothetical protein